MPINMFLRRGVPPPKSQEYKPVHGGRGDVTLQDYIERKTRTKPKLSYMDTVNSGYFRDANTQFYKAFNLLCVIMEPDEARGWLRAWAGEAGLGSE